MRHQVPCHHTLTAPFRYRARSWSQFVVDVIARAISRSAPARIRGTHDFHFSPHPSSNCQKQLAGYAAASSVSSRRRARCFTGALSIGVAHLHVALWLEQNLNGLSGTTAGFDVAPEAERPALARCRNRGHERGKTAASRTPVPLLAAGLRGFSTGTHVRTQAAFRRRDCHCECAGFRPAAGGPVGAKALLGGPGNASIILTHHFSECEEGEG